MDDLERRIRAARPTSGHRDLPLTERAERELAELTGDGDDLARRRHGLPRRRTWLASLSAAAVMIVVVAFAAKLLLGDSTAHAATPPMLATTPLSGSAASELRRLSAIAAESPGSTGDALTHIQTEAWVLNSTVADDGTLYDSTVQPQRYNLVRQPDGSIRRITTAGVPWGNDVPGAVPVGTVLSDVTWPPGEGLAFAEPAPTRPSTVASYLANYLGAEPPISGADSLQSISALLLEQNLNSQQTVALLDYLAELPDLSLTGTTVDRRGRDGVVVSAADPDQPEYMVHLIISPDSGRIIANERTYHGTSRTDIPSPSVIHYYLWS